MALFVPVAESLVVATMVALRISVLVIEFAAIFAVVTESAARSAVAIVPSRISVVVTAPVAISAVRMELSVNAPAVIVIGPPMVTPEAYSPA